MAILQAGIILLLADTSPELSWWLQVKLRRRAFLLNDRGFFVAEEELYLIVIFSDQYHVIEAYNFLLALIPPSTLLISNTFHTSTILYTIGGLDNGAHWDELCDVWRHRWRVSTVLECERIRRLSHGAIECGGALKSSFLACNRGSHGAWQLRPSLTNRSIATIVAW